MKLRFLITVHKRHPRPAGHGRDFPYNADHGVCCWKGQALKLEEFADENERALRVAAVHDFPIKIIVLRLEDPEPPAPEQPVSEAKPPFIHPKARKLAGEMGISLEGITGSGKDGCVTISDVQRAAARS